MAAEEMMRRNVAVEAEPGEVQEVQIDLMELFYRLLDKAWLIVLVGVLAAVVMGVCTHFFIDDSYTASTKLYVIGDNSAIDLTQLNFGDKLADDYVQVFKNRDVHGSVRKLLMDTNPTYTAARRNLIVELLGFEKGYSDPLPEPYETWVVAGYDLGSFEYVQRKMSVTQLNNTRILSISFVSGSPEEGRIVVAAYAKAAIAFISAKMGAEKPPTVFETPYASDIPTAPSMLKNVALAMMAGMAVMVLVFAGQFVIDDRIRTAEQLENRLGLPTLGMMPVQGKQQKSRKRLKEGHA